jgi:hypothetical protein
VEHNKQHHSSNSFLHNLSFRNKGSIHLLRGLFLIRQVDSTTIQGSTLIRHILRMFRRSSTSSNHRVSIDTCLMMRFDYYYFELFYPIRLILNSSWFISISNTSFFNFLII